MLTVIQPGMQTTIQDLTGRQGLWDVGVPPSGAVDELTFALLNAAVGNPTTQPAWNVWSPGRPSPPMKTDSSV